MDKNQIHLTSSWSSSEALLVKMYSAKIFQNKGLVAKALIKVRKSVLVQHWGDKSYLQNGISYTGKTAPLYWIRARLALVAIIGITFVYISDGPNHSLKTQSIYMYN